MSLVKVELDEFAVQEQIKTQISELIQGVDAEMVFWDRKELMRRTCMSWNSIQEHFFFDPDFPKAKIGAKWYFPARETREFLVTWLSKQKGA